MKKKFFIDTNVWLRFIIGDNKKQLKACQKLFSLNEQGKFKLYTSVIVLMEIAHTLRSFYTVSKKEIVSDLRDILSTRNLTLIEKTGFSKALALFDKLKIRLVDCLIATQLPAKTVICTYDQEFRKIKTVTAFTPEEILVSQDAN